MCEYCGCQAVAAIDELTREHEQVVNLIGRARAVGAADDIEAMAAVARDIAHLLASHTIVEEEGLFAALAADFPDHVASLTAEHRLLETTLGECATGTPTDPTWPRRFLAAMHLLRNHILAEQDGVFPAALANLESSDWDAIDAIRRRLSDERAATAV